MDSTLPHLKDSREHLMDTRSDPKHHREIPIWHLKNLKARLPFAALFSRTSRPVSVKPSASDKPSGHAPVIARPTKHEELPTHASDPWELHPAIHRHGPNLCRYSAELTKPLTM